MTGTASSEQPAGNDLPASVGDVAVPVAESGTRIASLDFIRGLAVMGILAANIVAFGQPFSAYMYPAAFLTPHGEAEGWMWVAQFVLIDGKMRGLFTLLFGAGLYLFMENAWAKGAGRGLQVRRLLLLGLFGLVHFFFIWRGDILFLYSVAGLFALLFIKLSAKRQLLLGVLGYLFGGLLYMGMGAAMEASASGAFGEEQVAEMEASKAEELAGGVLEAEIIRSGDYAEHVARNFTEHASDLAFTLFLFAFETLPLMLIGMALYRMGLFSGGLNQTKQRMWGWIGLLVGAAAHVPIALAARADGFDYYGTLAAFTGWSHFPRLAMTLGLAALLALWGQHAGGWLAQRVSAAGRAAFTNYLGTSVVMLFVFHGWAGGLYGELTRGELYIVTLLTCALMLAWSKPWLDRYRYGPLEWLWRCLTYGRLFALRR
ncbi:DUF418 domain-containing protein [Erythrobacter sp. W53]|uniref:DUF418 domain-containing protein n=1 Tax=Erythrobacter sp. W53 TaxID=3425947 RepID=UPI003D769E70